MKGGFMILDSLESFKAYQISHESINISDRIVYSYSHIIKAPTIPGSQDQFLNHFAYLQRVPVLPSNFLRQIYYGDSLLVPDNVVSFDASINKYCCDASPYL